MKLNRIMIAAIKSGSGKTTITCALLEALKNRGKQVVSYKCGPDYIDPMFHKQVLGIPSKNLDTFFTDKETTKELLLKNRRETDFIVMEGVMGLFDGLGGIKEEGSSYHLAEITKTPIILVADAKGMARSVIPMLAGFLAYDKERLIRGVILNRMTKSYYEMLKPMIEEELDIKVLGYFPEQKDIHLESRHLGLVMPNELTGLKRQIKKSAKELENTVNVDKIECMAQQAEEIEAGLKKGKQNICLEKNRENSPVIAVAKDEAFCFYYEDNLIMLQEKGAKIVYFSPLQDKKLPKDCDALLFGGGYPELHMDKLSSNVSMHREIRQAFKLGMPIVAECGGFMYLHKEIIGEDAEGYKMVGIVPEICRYKGKLVRFGYIELSEKKSSFLKEGQSIKGHEFHYYDSTNNGEGCIARKPVTDKTYSCIKSGENFWLGFPHLYYPSNPVFAENFVKKAAEYKKLKEIYK